MTTFAKKFEHAQPSLSLPPFLIDNFFSGQRLALGTMEPSRAEIRKPLVCLSGEREVQHQGLSKYPWLWINLTPRLTWRYLDEIAVSPWPTPVSPPQGKTVKGCGGRGGEESPAGKKGTSLSYGSPG